MNRTIITNVRIIDGSGAPAIEKGAFVMNHDIDDYKKDIIEYVGQMSELDIKKYSDSSNNVLNLEGYTLLPGLFNVHAHLDLELPYLPYLVDTFGDSYRTLVGFRRAAEALMCGVTTIRNVGGAGDFDLALRKAVEKNLVWAPRIVACGSPIAPHAGHGSTVPGTILCTGEIEFMKAVRENIAKDVDQIKIMFTGGLAGATEGINDKQIMDNELKVCIEVAHGANKKVAGHISYDEAAKTAVEFGIDSVEHGYQLTYETAKMMAERDTYYVPTLCVSNCGDYLKKHGALQATIDKLGQAEKTHKKSVENAIKAGVKICVGSDLLPSDTFGGTNATVREIELLVEAGMTPLEAIKAGTANSAELCGLSDVTGLIKAGLQGDIIAVKGKPDKEISDLRNLKLVAKGCRLVWADVTDMKLERYHILPPGCKTEGGTFIKW